jgi:hypothetical protein
MRGGLHSCLPVKRIMTPIGTHRFYRGLATRAVTEARVMNETGVVWVTAPLRHTVTVVTYLRQFSCIPRW